MNGAENPSRRQILRAAIAATTGSLLSTACSTPNMAGANHSAEWIDCHTHFYDPFRPEGPPPDFPPRNDPVLFQKSLPERFAAVALPHGVRSTIVVEASTWTSDNDWLLSQAEDSKIIRGVVGNLVPLHEGFADNLDRLRRNKLFCGIRLRGPGNPGLGEALENATWGASIAMLSEADLSLDLLTSPDQLEDVSRLAAAIPDLRIVINHIAGLRIDGKTPPDSFRRDLFRVAKHANVYCKISSLAEHSVGRAGKATTDPDYYAPAIDTFLETFGDERLIYGSNWPVCLNAASYATVFGIVDAYFQGKGDRSHRNFFCSNARRAYKYSDRD